MMEYLCINKGDWFGLANGDKRTGPKYNETVKVIMNITVMGIRFFQIAGYSELYMARYFVPLIPDEVLANELKEIFTQPIHAMRKKKLTTIFYIPFHKEDGEVLTQCITYNKVVIKSISKKVRLILN